MNLSFSHLIHPHNIVKCIESDVQRKRRSWSWEYIQEFLADKRRYIQLYTTKKQTYADMRLSDDEQRELAQLETKHTYKDIIMYAGDGVVIVETVVALLSPWPNNSSLLRAHTRC